METASFGYTIFYVNDVRVSLRFFREAFDLSERMLTPEGDYGELETGATTLAFASSALATDNLSAAGGFTPLTTAGPPPPVAITLLVSDVAAAVGRALEAGATGYVDPVQKPWGQAVAYVRDPNGVLVEIATPIQP